MGAVLRSAGEDFSGYARVHERAVRIRAREVRIFCGRMCYAGKMMRWEGEILGSGKLIKWRTRELGNWDVGEVGVTR